MYNVLDVCRYVINYSNDKDYDISNLKLQKLLYFIQAYFLINKNETCFNETIEAWDFGPVIPKAYSEYKQYGGGHIPSISSYIEMDSDNIWSVHRVKYNNNIFSNADKKMINDVINQFAEYTATDLTSLSQNQAPWNNIYEPYTNNEITKESIKEYFSD